MHGMSKEEWDAVISINLTVKPCTRRVAGDFLQAPFLCAREFASRMIGSGQEGVIVNISSSARNGSATMQLSRWLSCGGRVCLSEQLQRGKGWAGELEAARRWHDADGRQLTPSCGQRSWRNTTSGWEPLHLELCM